MKGFVVEEMDCPEEGSRAGNYWLSEAFESLNFPLAPARGDARPTGTNASLWWGEAADEP